MSTPGGPEPKNTDGPGAAIGETANDVPDNVNNPSIEIDHDIDLEVAKQIGPALNTKLPEVRKRRLTRDYNQNLPWLNNNNGSFSIGNNAFETMSFSKAESHFGQEIDWAQNSIIYQISSYLSQYLLLFIYYTLQIVFGNFPLFGISWMIHYCFDDRILKAKRNGSDYSMTIFEWCMLQFAYFLESFSPLILCILPWFFVTNDIPQRFTRIIIIPILVFAVTIVISRYYCSILNLISQCFNCFDCFNCFNCYKNKHLKHFKRLKNKDGYQALLYFWGIDVCYVPPCLQREILVLGSVVPSVVCALIIHWHDFDQFIFKCYEKEVDDAGCHVILDENNVKVGCCKKINETKDILYISTILFVNILFFYKLTKYMLIALLAHKSDGHLDKMLGRETKTIVIASRSNTNSPRASAIASAPKTKSYRQTQQAPQAEKGAQQAPQVQLASEPVTPVVTNGLISSNENASDRDIYDLL